jgi:tetraacyldisaccharide 4'-kinase
MMTPFDINKFCCNMLKKIILILLVPLEVFYRIGFKVVCAYKKSKCAQKSFHFKIISVGNLSVGGTGKSVVVPVLVRALSVYGVAVALRGYKGKVSKTDESVLVTDGTTIFVDKDVCGDEAFMYAQQLGVPVVVGKNRARSCQLIENHCKDVRYVILDDAYQHFSVKKNYDIVLLDARAPFDNGHCLPAGRLREKDYSRADAIVLTHADMVNIAEIERIKKKVLSSFDPKHIFCGRHAPAGIYHLNETLTDPLFLSNKNFLVVAGVGSFKGVIQTVEHAGVSVGDTYEYADHYAYEQCDVDGLLLRMQEKKLAGIVTTEKDWVKLFPLLITQKNWQHLPVYVIRVSFEFLSPSEYAEFIKDLRNL